MKNTMNTAMETSPANTGGVNRNLAGRYLAFRLGTESCGVAVRLVREIIGMTAIAPALELPSRFRGMINLRGKIIPILDLRIAFQNERGATAEGGCVIVAQLKSAGGSNALTGFMADAIEEVFAVAEVDLETAPDIRGAPPVQGFLGAARIKGKIIHLIDLQRIVTEAGWMTENAAGESARKIVDADARP